MPRPGPRPYECVRRAWHSDRHQPIRGSLIQEIFRVVNEIHCSKTKKNKEWQEKLPIVVIKSEEIMYSKANSEDEYMDLETLLDRANDAINTIIRRDETNETGDLLQPCIEAALTLGCTPRRTSRSQRNNTPHCYLSGSNAQETIKEQISFWQRNSLMKNCTENGLVSLHASQPQPSSVYPLYYGSCPEAKALPCNFRFLDDGNHELVGSELQEGTTFCDIKMPEMTCDLSLRLGPHQPQQNEQSSSFHLKRQKLCYSTTDVEDHRPPWLSELSCGFADQVQPRRNSGS